MPPSTLKPEPPKSSDLLQSSSTLPTQGTHHRTRRSSLPAPTPPPNAPRIVVFGAGSRGTAYSKCIRASGLAQIVAVCEPRGWVRSEFGRKFVWEDRGAEGEGQAFEKWEEWVEYERERRGRGMGSSVDVAFVCVLDEQHVAACVALAGLGGIHVLCEKPLATTLKGCVGIWAAFRRAWERDGAGTVVGIGHVLRYSPHNVLLRQLVRGDKVIGDVMSVEHTEPVGWWHFTHSYVRGNWRKESSTAPSLLTKSCHDIDFLLWLLCTPDPGVSEPPHLPSTISSSGSLRNYRKARKPVAAGNATNCLQCPIEQSCKASAVQIYWRNHAEFGKTGWPVKIVVPEMEDMLRTKGKEESKARLMEVLSQDYDSDTPIEEINSRQWYGRCVYESDNDVNDDQTVVMEWQDDPLLLQGDEQTEVGGLNNRGAKTALFHMVAQTQAICERRGRIYGSDGEIHYNSSTISVTNFRTGYTKTHRAPASSESGHGGGDDELALNMIRAVLSVRDGIDAEEAQRKFLGVDLEEIVRSHAAVFAAEDARRTKKVIDWNDWWATEVDGHLKEYGIKT